MLFKYEPHFRKSVFRHKLLVINCFSQEKVEENLYSPSSMSIMTILLNIIFFLTSLVYFLFLLKPDGAIFSFYEENVFNNFMEVISSTSCLILANKIGRRNVALLSCGKRLIRNKRALKKYLNFENAPK